jgi:hypothetical protein
MSATGDLLATGVGTAVPTGGFGVPVFSGVGPGFGPGDPAPPAAPPVPPAGGFGPPTSDGAGIANGVREGVCPLPPVGDEATLVGWAAGGSAAGEIAGACDTRAGALAAGSRATGGVPPESAARPGVPSAGVGSNGTQPSGEKATSAHWCAWSALTVCVSAVGEIDQPDTTLEGIPAARARTTNALLKLPQVPVRCSNRNWSTGSPDVPAVPAEAAPGALVPPLPPVADAASAKPYL